MLGSFLGAAREETVRISVTSESPMREHDFKP